MGASRKGSMTDTEEQAVRQRIKKTIDSKKVKLSEFSKQSGIPYPTLREYYNGLRKPGFEAIATLLSFTGVSGDWLLLGRGEMFVPRSLSNDREGLLGKIAQEVEFAFADLDGKQLAEDEHNHHSDPEFKKKMAQVGRRTVIAATIYRDTANIKDEVERKQAIRSQANKYAHFQRSVETIELNDLTH
jgi:transcriptional regulator with XRE-family HTH domain